jgi:hypothetical protein
MRRRDLLLALPLLSLARGQGGGDWTEAFGAFIQKVPPASYLVYPTEANDLLLFEPFILDVRTPEERKKGFIRARSTSTRGRFREGSPSFPKTRRP